MPAQNFWNGLSVNTLNTAPLNWIWVNRVFASKKIKNIPYNLIGELVTKMSANDWIMLYASNVRDARKRKK